MHTSTLVREDNIQCNHLSNLQGKGQDCSNLFCEFLFLRNFWMAWKSTHTCLKFLQEKTGPCTSRHLKHQQNAVSNVQRIISLIYDTSHEVTQLFCFLFLSGSLPPAVTVVWWLNIKDQSLSPHSSMAGPHPQNVKPKASNIRLKG